MEIFYNLDNGGKTLKTIKKDNIVSIYKVKEDYEDIPCLELKINKLLKGEAVDNKMTRFSGGNDRSNSSILLEIDDNVYVYVGPLIYSFKPQYNIIKFISAVGNSSVVYPWAIDSHNNYYLMDYDKVIMLNPTDDLLKHIRLDNNPYSYYYDNENSGIPLIIEPLIERINY